MTSDRLKELEDQVAASASGLDGIDALNALAWELLEQDRDRARSLAERALECSQIQEAVGHIYLRGTAQALITLGELAINSGAYGLALTRLLEAYALLQGQLFPDLLALASHSIGWAHQRLGNSDEAFDFLNRALKLYQESGNAEKEASVLTSLGTAYSSKGVHEQAMESFQHALLLQENQAVSRSKGVTLNNLASAQGMLGATAEAIASAQAGLVIFRALGLESLEAKGLDTLGKAYFAAGDYAHAEETFEECLAKSRKINSEYLDMEVMLTLGKIYLEQNQVDRAREHFHKALQIADSRQSHGYRYKYHEMLAGIYEAQGNLQEALLHLKEFHDALELSLAEATSYRVENLKILHQVEKTGKEAEVLWLSNRALEREIDERLRERAELEKLATTDPLTGLYNRRHLFTLGEYELERSHKEGHPLSVLLLDIDHFKLVNDNFSHATGDQVLIEISRLLATNGRKGDVCCRYGGEEFVILLPYTQIASAQEVSERLRQVISNTPIRVGDDEIHITASLGVAQAGPGDADLAAVIARADQAMYRSKLVGRN